MPSETVALDRVFHSLANATRRQIIEQLSRQPASMTDLAEGTKLSLPSFLQHLQVLENAGLVVSQKEGRVRTYEICPPKIFIAENWLDVQRWQWNQRLDQLDELLINLNENPSHE